MTPIETRLAEIEARLKAATPGPWQASAASHVIQTNHLTRDVWHICTTDTGFHQMEEWAANAKLIANAPQDLADLIAEVKRLEQKVKTLTFGFDTTNKTLAKILGENEKLLAVNQRLKEVLPEATRMLDKLTNGFCFEGKERDYAIVVYRRCMEALSDLAKIEATTQTTETKTKRRESVFQETGSGAEISGGGKMSVWYHPERDEIGTCQAAILRGVWYMDLKDYTINIFACTPESEGWHYIGEF